MQVAKEARSTGSKLGPDFHSGQGAWLITSNGERYFDGTAGSGAISLGHQHPAVVAACQQQLNRLTHTGCKLGSDVRTQLAETIAKLVPFKDANVLFCVIGTEAVETAFKVARAKTGRKPIAGLEYAFHGKSSGALAITWRWHFKKYSFISPEDSCIIPSRDLSDANLIRRALESFRTQLSEAAARNMLPAAIIFEPVQVTEGVRLFPTEYLDGLLRIAREFGVISIMDEIYTGMGRCGRLFFCQYLSQKPDLILLGKSLGNGMPISLVVGERDLINVLESGVQTSTYSGHPLACAAALAVCDQVMLTQLWEKAERLGAELAEFVRSELAPIGLVSAVRQIGMLIGFDLSSDRLPGDQLCQRFISIALAHNLLLFGGGAKDNTIKLVPPVEISDSELAFLKNSLRQALQQLVGDIEQ